MSLGSCEPFVNSQFYLWSEPILLRLPLFIFCYYLHNTRKRHVSGLTTTSGNHINQILRSLRAQEIYYRETPSGSVQWNVEREETVLFLLILLLFLPLLCLSAFVLRRDPSHLRILYDSYSISLSPPWLENSILRFCVCSRGSLKLLQKNAPACTLFLPEFSEKIKGSYSWTVQCNSDLVRFWETF